MLVDVPKMLPIRCGLILLTLLSLNLALLLGDPANFDFKYLEVKNLETQRDLRLLLANYDAVGEEVVD